jgi:hypothetical protein
MPFMEDPIELRIPEIVSLIDDAMHCLLITVRTYFLAGWQPHQVGFPLRTVNGTRQLRLLIDAPAVGSLRKSPAQWRMPESVND